jgi:hypothetical protein
MRRGLIVKPQEKSKSSSIESPPKNNDDSFSALKPPVNRRKKLPREQMFGAAITVMAILTKSLPVCAFEPLSDVQAAAEEFRYAKQFLDKMPSVEDPMERMILICGFIVSGYSGMVGRRRKPFNPLLGETYDYISEDGWRYHGEKVRQDPSIIACHAEGRGWEFFQALQERTSFSLNSVSITSDLPVRLKFANGDDYSWTKVTTTVQNARGEAQNRRVLNEGEMLVKSNIGVQATLTFHGNEENTIAGEIVRTQDSAVLCHLIGGWDRGLNKVLPNKQVSKVFEPIPASKHAENYYGFSDFAMALNEIHDYEHPYLPVTDSRYRPDSRHLENGEAKLTEQATKKLNQTQRKRSNQQHKPLWFQKEHDEFTGEDLWQPNKKYWKSKEAQFRDEHSRQMIQLFEKKS